MRKAQRMGTKYDVHLDKQLDANQADLADALSTPHSYQMNEILGCSHRIVAKAAAYNVEAQPTQARGHIVWSKAYSFQPAAPSFLDPVPAGREVPDAR